MEQVFVHTATDDNTKLHYAEHPADPAYISVKIERDGRTINKIDVLKDQFRAMADVLVPPVRVDLPALPIARPISRTESGNGGVPVDLDAIESAARAA